MATQTSPKYQLNKADGMKILKGLGIAIGGAVLVFLADLIPNVDFGQYAYIAIPLFSTLVNAGLKFFKNK